MEELWDRLLDGQSKPALYLLEGKAGVHFLHAGQRADGSPGELAEALEITCNDLQKEIVLTRNVMARDHLGNLRHGSFELRSQFGAMALHHDVHEGRDAPT